MHRHHYVLQGHLYHAALRRHVGQRLGLSTDDPRLSEAMGGIVYVFLRGLDGEGGGLWHHRPAPELSIALDQALSGSVAQAAAGAAEDGPAESENPPWTHGAEEHGGSR